MNDAAALRCSACGALLEVGSAFPGALVTCRYCGGGAVVPLPAGRSDPHRDPGPYRTASAGEITEAAGRVRPPRASRSIEGAPCPRCQAPLDVAMVSGVQIHECRGKAGACQSDGCGGVFASHDALAMLLAVARQDEALTRGVAPPPSVTHAIEARAVYLRCPGCDDPMNRSRFAADLPVVVDVCKTHGLWLDRGEMASALAFAGRGGHYDPVKHRGRRVGDPPAPTFRAIDPERVAAAAHVDSPAVSAAAAFGADLLGELIIALLA